MKRICALAGLLLLAGGLTLGATEVVGVRGSNTHFTTTMDITVGEKPVRLTLTGVALREKYFINIYAVASYVMGGASVHTAEELAALDQPKQLHLVLERDVAGNDMAEAFLIAIRQNYPAPAFAQEVDRLTVTLRELELKKSDHIYLTHLPGVGLRCNVMGKGDFTIENPQFSRAVWDIYFGKNNLGEGIKKGLVSRLK
jgi:hypothetical protein